MYKRQDSASKSKTLGSFENKDTVNLNPYTNVSHISGGGKKPYLLLLDKNFTKRCIIRFINFNMYGS